MLFRKSQGIRKRRVKKRSVWPQKNGGLQTISFSFLQGLFPCEKPEIHRLRRMQRLTASTFCKLSKGLLHELKNHFRLIIWKWKSPMSPHLTFPSREILLIFETECSVYHNIRRPRHRKEMTDNYWCQTISFWTIRKTCVIYFLDFKGQSKMLQSEKE